MRFAPLVLSALVCATTFALAQERAPRQITIAASGDALLHIKVVKAAETHGWARVFGGLKQSLDTREVAFVNLETPLVDDVRDVRTGSPPILGAPSSAARGLAEAGVDVVGLANNHSYDQRAIGMARTIEALDHAGVVAVGAHADEARAYGHSVIERHGVRVAFLSYTERINGGPGGRPPAAYVASLRNTEDRLDDALRSARRDADVVVLGVHWSHDFIDTPRRGQRRRAERWIEAGADLILGTGPHVLQRVERLPSPRGEAVVAYSLGNLVSNQGKRFRYGRSISDAVHPALRLPETRDGVVLRTQFELGSQVRVGSLRATPLWTANNFWEMAAGREREYDIRVTRWTEPDDPLAQARRAAVQAALGEAVVVDPIEAAR